MKEEDFKPGSSVIVKANVMDPDWGIDISGWQGRVQEIEKEVICIAWDSITLQDMPGKMIERSEEQGLDWQIMYLGIDEVEPSSARDTVEHVVHTAKLLEKKHRWSELGAKGRRIRTVLAEVDIDDEKECFTAWGAYLSSALKFPFASRIWEATELLPIEESRRKLTFGQKMAEAIRSIFRGAKLVVLPPGTEVTILGIYASDEEDGVLARIQDEGKSYAFPVGNLDWRKSAKTARSILEDYAVWLANH